jgi:hypothetical protein
LGDKIKKLEEEIEQIISKSPTDTDLEHARSAKKWVLRLKPDADQALQIAALAHDIERGTITPEQSKIKEDFSRYDEIKKIHGKLSADIICDLLKKHGFDKPFIERVGHLVELHEFGGDEDTDILKDADSIAFFEENIGGYLPKFGEEKLRNKIKFMFDRMSEKAKNIVKNFKYDNPKLNKIFKEVVS